MSTGGKGARRRAEIVTAARAALLDGGLDGFSMRALADSLDMTLGNLQYYFPTRDDLLEAVVEAQVDLELALIEPARASEPVARLAAAVDAWAARWTWGQGSVYIGLRSLAQHDERFAALATRVWTRIYEELTAMVHGIDPACPAVEAQARARLISSLIDGSSFQIYTDRGTLSRTRLVPRIAAVALAIARGEVGSA